MDALGGLWGITRKYWMNYRLPGFLAVVWFGSSPHPVPLFHQQVVSLSQSSCVSPVELTDGRGRGMVGGWAKSYDGEKAWSSINQLILSGDTYWGNEVGGLRWRHSQVLRHLEQENNIFKGSWYTVNKPGFGYWPDYIFSQIIIEQKVLMYLFNVCKSEAWLIIRYFLSLLKGTWKRTGFSEVLH